MRRLGSGILLLLCWLLALAPAAHAEARIALLITNQAYRQPGAALADTHRDGEILRAALEKVGFKVCVVKDTATSGHCCLNTALAHVQQLCGLIVGDWAHLPNGGGARNSVLTVALAK